MGYGADDIILKGPESQNSTKKSKKGNVFLVIFFLIIILSGGVAGVWYYTNYILVTPKATFFQYVVNNNFDNILDFNVYYNMLNQLNNKSFSTQTNANYTTTIKNDITENADASKFEFILNTLNNKAEDKSLSSAKITYASNDLFDLKLLNTDNNIGILSEEISDKYIVSSKDELNNSIKRATGKETKLSADIIDNTFNKIINNKIDFDENYKKEKISKYYEILYRLIPESNVIKKENVIVTLDSEQINTNAYILSLDKEKYVEVLKTSLEKLKNDDELLNIITTGSAKFDDINLFSNLKINEKNLYSDFIQAFIFKQKVDGTVDELKKKIDDEIFKLSNIEEGIKIDVYVSNIQDQPKETKKVVFELPNKTTLDIEYLENDKTKITYLSPEKDEQEKEIIVGDSIQIEKIFSDVNVKYNIEKNNIKENKIISKIKLELQTNTSNISKGYTNNIIIRYNNNEGNLKVNVKNEIKFEEKNIEDDFSDENSIFVNTLNDEELQDLYVNLFQKVMSVYAEKMVSLSFIENKSINAIIQQPVIEETNFEEKERIKNKLIEVVSNMMGEAQQNGEIFTIQNLEGLTIEGYDVTSSVSEDLAIIKINGYTFNIDKDFMLSD